MGSQFDFNRSCYSSLVAKLFLVVLCVCWNRPPVHAIQPSNVLVLYNADDGSAGAGQQIANHYQQLRPGVHTLGLTGINPILSGAFNEDVSAADYLSVIRPQVLSEIGSIADTIDVIVTTKGLPLRINAGPDQGGTPKWKRFSSLESELTRIDTVSTIQQMGDQFWESIIFGGSHQAFNPYYSSGIPFDHTNPNFESMRLSTRLDGHSVQDVTDALDRAQSPFVIGQNHTFILDDDPTAGVDQIIPLRDNVLGPAGLPYIYDPDNTTIVSSTDPVIGYVSHGANDGSGGLEAGYIENQLQFQLADGAVFHTHESFNAKSFDPAFSQTQGLVAEWLKVGGTAGLGHVAEPLNGPTNITNEKILFDRMLDGWTFAEAAWAATWQLSYANTVVGDPLMVWQPELTGLPGDTNDDSIVEFIDFYTLQGNWMQPGQLQDGDFNGDGFVNQDDFYLLQGNWMSSVSVPATTPTNVITVLPELDPETGAPILSATLSNPANFDGDIDVDGDDAAIWANSYGQDGGGDADGDGDTDGADFLLWQRNYSPYTLTADFNLDMSVDQADLLIWQSSYNRNQGGDANGDGRTDGSDLLIWQREFSASASHTTNPEPTSISLLLLGAILATLTSRQTANRRSCAR
ncbi:MAG: hypothetical protein MI725_02415 [Pirellulales bacterium]|nr:hypothetical protein [Pirellulales bacterium]